MIILPKELSEELKEAKNKLAMFESLRDLDGEFLRFSFLFKESEDGLQRNQ